MIHAYHSMRLRWWYTTDIASKSMREKSFPLDSPFMWTYQELHERLPVSRYANETNVSLPEYQADLIHRSG